MQPPSPAIASTDPQLLAPFDPSQARPTGLGAQAGCIAGGQVPNARELLSQLGSFDTFLKLAQQIGAIPDHRRPVLMASQMQVICHERLSTGKLQGGM